MLRIENPNFLSKQLDQKIIKNEKNVRVIGNQTDNLMWFMQVSSFI
jgi:hypothetical protein